MVGVVDACARRAPGCRVTQAKDLYLTLLRELIGADVLSAVNLPPPRAGLLRVPSPDDVTGTNPAATRARTMFKKDEGTLAFCSAYIEAPVISAGELLHPEKHLRKDLVLLFATDVLLSSGACDHAPGCFGKAANEHRR